MGFEMALWRISVGICVPRRAHCAWRMVASVAYRTVLQHIVKAVRQVPVAC